MSLKKDALEKGTLRCLSCKRKIHIHSSPTSSILPVKGNLVLLSKRGEEPKKVMDPNLPKNRIDERNFSLTGAKLKSKFSLPCV